MADKTGIEWTRGDDGTPGATWNPVTGCTRISDGCTHCYIERTPPFRMEGRRFDGPHIGATTGVRLHPERLEMPLRWKRPRRIFVNSLADLFHDEVPDGFIAQVWDVMARSPQHTFQVLTKRHARMRSWVTRWADRTGDEVAGPYGLPPMPRGPEAVRGTYSSGRSRLFADMLERMGEPPEGCAYPTYDWSEGQRWLPEALPNVWLGVSVENQRWADARIPALLETPAAVRWISVEPLLGPVDLTPYVMHQCDCPPEGHLRRSEYGPRLDWVVAGGESGPGARPMHPDWVRSIRDRCQAAGVPFLFKQHGEWAPLGPLYGDLDETDDAHMEAVGLEVHEGREVVQLERDGYIAEGHQPADDRTWLMARVGKKRAGRELDGRSWDEYPGEAR